MTSQKKAIVVDVERKLVESLVEDLLPALQLDVSTAIAMHKISCGGEGGKKGYLDQLEGVGLLRWFSSPTKTCGHVTAESQSTNLACSQKHSLKTNS